LAIHGIYSTADDKYVQLETRPLAPLALFLISSGEVTRKAKGLARRAGVFILTSNDLFVLFRRKWQADAIEVQQKVLPDLIRRELEGITVAR